MKARQWLEHPPIPEICLHTDPLVMSGNKDDSSLPSFKGGYEAEAAELVAQGKVTADLIRVKDRECPPIDRDIVGRRIEYIFKRQVTKGKRWDRTPEMC